MIINRQLTIDGNVVEIGGRVDISLTMSFPGRAVFEVITDKKPTGIIQYDTGTTRTGLIRYFTGIIERSRPSAKNAYIVTCMELSGRFLFNTSISLRHCSMLDVLAEISKVTGLKFSTNSAADYNNKIVARFVNAGNAIVALNNLSTIFDIKDFFWQQLGQGSIFIGDWTDSRWSNKLLPLPRTIKYLNGGQIEMPFLPSLRPGVKISSGSLDGQYIIRTKTDGQKVIAECSAKF